MITLFRDKLSQKFEHPTNSLATCLFVALTKTGVKGLLASGSLRRFVFYQVDDISLTISSRLSRVKPSSSSPRKSHLCCLETDAFLSFLLVKHVCLFGFITIDIFVWPAGTFDFQWACSNSTWSIVRVCKGMDTIESTTRNDNGSTTYRVI